MKKILITAFLFVMAAGISLSIGSCTKPQNLDINSASVEELNRIPMVDPQLAENIVAYRNANGPFAALDELLNVKGMDQERLQEIKPFVFIGWEPPAQMPE
jgi:competence protein ComEA